MSPLHSAFDLMHIVFSILFCVVAGIALRLFFHLMLKRAALRDGLQNAAIIDKALSLVIVSGSLLFGLDMFLPVTLFPEWLIPYVHPTLVSCALIILVLVLPEVVTSFFVRRSSLSASVDSRSSLLHRMLRFSIYLLGIMLVLDAYGVKVTTMIATLGIGGLALALALQDTLSNLFAGMTISVADQIKPGDIVLFDSFEGTIVEIGWRNTLIRKGDESLLIAPNSKLSQSIINAYQQATPFFRTKVVLQVSVEQDLVALMKRIQSIVQDILASDDERFAALMRDQSVFFRCSEAREGAVEISIHFCVRSYATMGLTRSELFLYLHDTLRAEDIQFHKLAR